MDKEIVKKIVSDKLKDISFIENSALLVGKYIFNEYVLGIYFIDYEDNGLPSDLVEYQEKYISSEYYRSPGYLQWNYYLIFLRSQYDPKEKQIIEKDGIYTRKFVFTPCELTDYFGYKKSEQVIETDVVSYWKEKLRKVDLDEVYSYAPYTQAISRFLSDEVIKDTDESVYVTEKSQHLTIKKITTLKLSKEYREYPIQKNYNLGLVNLITGANGTGKTSFLEAIELIITGKNFRNPDFNEEYGCIEATYNDSDSDIYYPGNNFKYRTRDKMWFSNIYPKGNDLYLAFNKYNFYDSDAAYNLSYNSNVNDLTRYISSIALGSEFNRIEDRLNGFKERLQKEQRVRNRQIKEERDRLRNSKVILENTKLISSPEEQFQFFHTYAKEIKWVKNIPKRYNESFSEFAYDYQTVQSIITSLDKIMKALKLNNLKDIQSELNKFEKALEDCSTSTEKIKEIKETLSAKRHNYNEMNKVIKILESARRFYNEESSFELWQLNKRIDSISQEVKKDSRVLEYLGQITDLDIFRNSIIFDNFKMTQIKEYQDLNKKHKDLHNQIDNLKLNLTRLQQLVSDIKSYGKQYLMLKKDANSCPLCETPFSFNELSSRISSIAKEFDENIAILNINSKIINLEKDLTKVNSTLTHIQNIEAALSVLSESEYSHMSMLEIGIILNSCKSSIDKKIEEQSKLLLLKEKLEIKGFSEEDFNKMKEEFEHNIPEIKFIYDQKEKFESYFSNFSKIRENLFVEIEESEKTLYELRDSLQKTLEKVFPNIDFTDYERILKYQIDILQKAILNFKDIHNYLNSSENEDSTIISQKLDKLYRLYENINKSLADQNELKLANQIITESQKNIDTLQPIYEKISNGLQIIDEILISNAKSKVLGGFIEKNEKDIQEIFKNIHSPKEFNEIKFSENENKILLKKSDNTETPLNKISAGQRSALALSIFLALNKRLEKGPNLILFDDPVTYIDDLNILSFLDYLREMIIYEGRQLLFSTANQKLAGLFEKKFSFLKEIEFKKFHFER